MPDKHVFEVVNKNVNKFEIRLDKYNIASIQTPVKINNKTAIDKASSSGDVTIQKQEVASDDKASEEIFKEARSEAIQKYSAFSEIQIKETPKLCLWHYMSEKEVQNILELSNKTEIRKIIDSMGSEHPKGICRTLFIELMYSIVRFCQKCKFNLSQSGAILSMFYLTHRYFTSSFHTDAENTFNYFKEFLLLHCLDSPPNGMKLFSYKESTYVIQYFCTIYLRNLPLIRLMVMPNFGFYFQYEIPPDPVDKKGKSKKEGKKKNKK